MTHTTAWWPDGSLKDYTDALQELIDRLRRDE
jgi:hypothetical protein